MQDLFGREEIGSILDKIKETNEKLVTDLIPDGPSFWYSS